MTGLTKERGTVPNTLKADALKVIVQMEPVKVIIVTQSSSSLPTKGDKNARAGLGETVGA